MLGDGSNRKEVEMRDLKGSISALLVFSSLVFGTYMGEAQASATASHATKLALVDWNCLSRGQAKPVRIVLACGDGNAVAEHLTWLKWSSSTATANGDLHQNDCVPDCAAGHFHTYPARFTLSETVSAAGRNYFTRVTMRFTHNEPTGKRSESVKDCFDSPPAAYIPRCPPDLQGAG
jgi:hypothetical protein